MKNFAKKIIKNSEPIRFIIVGAIATILHYVSYYFLCYIMHVNIAYTIGYALSLCVNFILSAKFTFRATTSFHHGMGFVFSHMFNYSLQMIVLNIMLYYGVSDSIAPIFVYIFCVPINFILVRYVFRH